MTHPAIKQSLTAPKPCILYISNSNRYSKFDRYLQIVHVEVMLRNVQTAAAAILIQKIAWFLDYTECNITDYYDLCS